MDIVRTPGSPWGVLVYGIHEFTGEYVVINSSHEEPFAEMLVGVSLISVSHESS